METMCPLYEKAVRLMMKSNELNYVKSGCGCING
mgnify:CR=1 FL=1